HPATRAEGITRCSAATCRAPRSSRSRSGRATRAASSPRAWGAASTATASANPRRIRSHPPYRWAESVSVPERSARLEDHERDLALRPPLVIGVAAVRGHDARPEPGALIGRGDTRPHRAALAADPDAGVRVRHQVVEPGRVPRVAALRGDDHEVRSVLDVEQGRRPLDAALGADVVEQEHRRAHEGDAPPDPPAGGLVDKAMEAEGPAQDGPAPVGEIEVAHAKADSKGLRRALGGSWRACQPRRREPMLLLLGIVLLIMAIAGGVIVHHV